MTAYPTPAVPALGPRPLPVQVVVVVVAAVAGIQFVLVPQTDPMIPPQ